MRIVVLPGIVAICILASTVARAQPTSDAEPAGPPAPPAAAEPDAPPSDAPRPEIHYTPHPEEAVMPPPVEEAPNPFAPVSFASNGAPIRVRLDRADGMANRFACTTPCTMTVPVGAYKLHTEGDGLRTYDNPLEVRSNGFKMTLGAGKKKDFLWGVGLTAGATAAILAWCAVFVPQLVNGTEEDPYGNAAFTGSLVGVGIVAVAGFAVGGYLLSKNPKGPVSVRPNLTPKPATSAGLQGLRFTF